MFLPGSWSDHTSAYHKKYRFLTHKLQNSAMLKLLLLHKIILRNSTLLGKLILASGGFKPFMNSYITLPFVALIMFYFIYKQQYLSQQLYDEHVHLHVSASPDITTSGKGKRIKNIISVNQTGNPTLQPLQVSAREGSVLWLCKKHFKPWKFNQFSKFFKQILNPPYMKDKPLNYIWRELAA